MDWNDDDDDFLNPSDPDYMIVTEIKRAPAQYTCEHCNKVLSLHNKYNHLRVYHEYTEQSIKDLKEKKRTNSIWSTANQLYYCGGCEEEYSTERGLKKHEKSCSKLSSFSSDSTVTAQIECPICEKKYKSHDALASHCKNDHELKDDDGDAVDYNIYNYTFQNAIDFSKWKSEIEEDNIVSYVTRSSRWNHDKTIHTKYMRCNRAGTCPTNKTVTISKRVVRSCTAYMKIVFNKITGIITVDLCTGHVGHKMEIGQLRLDEESEKQIAKLLKEGFSPSQVKEKIRKQYGSATARIFYITNEDIRRIKEKYGLYDGRRDKNDMISFMMRIDENNKSDGIRHYDKPKDESGDGFSLVIITDEQLKWLDQYGRKTIGVDDTYHVTQYSLRLATIMVIDSRGRGKPAGFLLSFRMTEKEIGLLFNVIKKYVPDFETEYFMTDDAASFWNGFTSAFPNTKACKLLCNFHTMQSIKRQGQSKIKSAKIRQPFFDLMSRTCRSTTKEKFCESYSTALTYLADNKEIEMITYMQTYWSGRVSEWAPYSRLNSQMNTSTSVERWHRELKRNILHSQTKIRLDYLVEMLIQAVIKYGEEHQVQEARKIVQGSYRLQVQHQNHSIAIKEAARMLIEKLSDHIWTVTSSKDNNTLYRVEISPCNCPREVNGHCRLCDACPFSLCTCLNSHLSGVCCKHVHHIMTAGNGRLVRVSDGAKSASTTPSLNTLRNEVPIAEDIAENDLSVMEVAKADTAKELMNQIESELSRIKRYMLDCVNKRELESMEHMLEKLKNLRKYPKEHNESTNTHELLPLTQHLGRGRPNNATPIRLQTRNAAKDKRVAKKLRLTMPSYEQDDMQVCALCYSVDPPNDEEYGDAPMVSWLKCSSSSCGIWVHDCLGCGTINKLCFICQQGNYKNYSL